MIIRFKVGLNTLSLPERVTGVSSPVVLSDVCCGRMQRVWVTRPSSQGLPVLPEGLGTGQTAGFTGGTHTHTHESYLLSSDICTHQTGKQTNLLWYLFILWIIATSEEEAFRRSSSLQLPTSLGVCSDMKISIWSAAPHVFLQVIQLYVSSNLFGEIQGFLCCLLFLSLGNLAVQQQAGHLALQW